MTIAGIFLEKVILSVQWLPDHQWSDWEIVTLSTTVLFLLICLTKLQRNRKVRKKYQDQFLESTPYMGMIWGVHNKSRYISKDLEKNRLAPVHKHQNKKHLQTKEPLEKPHERTKASHFHTNIYKPTKERSEQEISESTADNKKLQCELTKLAKAESKIAEMADEHGLLQEEIKQLKNEINKHKQAKVSLEEQVSELTADNKKMQRELTKLAKAESKIAEMTAEFRQLQKEEFQVEQISEHQIVTEPAVETPVSRKTTRRNKINKQQHRIVEGVRQKLCRKCNEWKPESEFHKNSSSKDNLAGSCKICKSNAARERRRRRKVVQR